MLKGDTYLDKLKQRGKDSHVYRKYQLIGLEISQILQDEKHKSLYIKLAKERNGEQLMQLAKETAERQGVKNKGAYFMFLLKEQRLKAPIKIPLKNPRKSPAK